jgi:hypothetical protein
MRFFGWIIDTSGKVIGAIYETAEWPGCFVAACVLLFSCYCLWGTISLGPIALLGFIAEKIDPYNLLMSSAQKELVQQISEGHSPIELTVQSRICNQDDDCGYDPIYRPDWHLDPGQRYMVITVRNNTPQNLRGKAIASEMTFPDDPELNLVCNMYLDQSPVNELDPGRWFIAYCTAKKLPSKVCIDYSFPNLYLEKLPAEHPRTTVCSSAEETK